MVRSFMLFTSPPRECNDSPFSESLGDLDYHDPSGDLVPVFRIWGVLNVVVASSALEASSFFPLLRYCCPPNSSCGSPLRWFGQIQLEREAHCSPVVRFKFLKVTRKTFLALEIRDGRAVVRPFFGSCLFSYYPAFPLVYSIRLSPREWMKDLHSPSLLFPHSFSPSLYPYIPLFHCGTHYRTPNFITSGVSSPPGSKE